MRTEHRLRMTFEPDYAEKYERLLDYRRDVIKFNRGIFLQPIVLITITLSMICQIILYKNVAAILIIPTSLLVAFGIPQVLEYIEMRRSLGL